MFFEMALFSCLKKYKNMIYFTHRRSGRVVEGGGLENR